MKNDKKCPLCSGQGWLAVVDKYNMPIQAQCKYCGGSGKLFAVSSNSECQHEYEYVNTTPFIGHKCKKCGHFA